MRLENFSQEMEGGWSGGVDGGSDQDSGRESYEGNSNRVTIVCGEQSMTGSRFVNTVFIFSLKQSNSCL